MESLLAPQQIEKYVSNIDLNPIDVVEKLGKYEFIYDFSNKICSSGFAGGFLCFGKEFSKGDVIDVVRFETPITIVGTPIRNAIIKINNKEESSIPKEYLSKVDDSSVITVNTGINFGANIKQISKPAFQMYPLPLPDVKTPTKVIADQLIEQNSTYVLNEDFGYNKTDNTNAHIIPNLKILNKGTKVMGNVFRPTVYYKTQAGVYIPENRFDYLEVKGLTDSDSLKIPLLKLTKDIPTNSSAVVPAKNDYKKLLIIAGAFFLGYALFSNGKSSN